MPHHCDIGLWSGLLVGAGCRLQVYPRYCGMMGPGCEVPPGSLSLGEQPYSFCSLILQTSPHLLCEKTADDFVWFTCLSLHECSFSGVQCGCLVENHPTKFNAREYVKGFSPKNLRKFPLSHQSLRAIQNLSQDLTQYSRVSDIQFYFVVTSQSPAVNEVVSCLTVFEMNVEEMSNGSHRCN